MGRIVLLHEEHLARIIALSKEIATEEYKIVTGELNPTISQNKAQKVYGRRTLERWVESGLVTRYTEYSEDGTVLSYKYSIVELMEVSLSTKVVKDSSQKSNDEYRDAIKMTMNLRR